MLPIVVLEKGKMVRKYVNRKSEPQKRIVNYISPVKRENYLMRHGKSIQQTESNQQTTSTTIVKKIQKVNRFETAWQPMETLTDIDEQAVEIRIKNIKRIMDKTVKVPVSITLPLPYLRISAFRNEIMSTYRSILTTAKHSLESIKRFKKSSLSTEESVAFTAGITNNERIYQSTKNEFQPTTETVRHYRNFPHTTLDWARQTTISDMSLLEIPSTTTPTKLPQTEQSTQTNAISTTITTKLFEETRNTLEMETSTKNQNYETSTLSITPTNIVEEIIEPMRISKTPIRIMDKLNDDLNSMDYVADAGVENIRSKSLGTLNEISYFSDSNNYNNNNYIDNDNNNNDKYQDEYKMDQLTPFLIQRIKLNRFTRSEKQVLRSIFIGDWKAIRKEVKELEYITNDNDPILMEILKQ